MFLAQSREEEEEGSVASETSEPAVLTVNSQATHH